MAKKKVTSKKPSTSKKKVEKKEETKEEPIVAQNRVQIVPHVKRKTIFNTKK